MVLLRIQGNKMGKANKRLFLGFAVSLVLHLLLLGGAWLFSNKTMFEETSDEIYEASDVIADFAQELDEIKLEDVQKVARRHVTQIEIFPIDNNSLLNKLWGRSRVIARQVDDERLKAQRKTIPVVKNPATKPKLLYRTPVFYPDEAGGEVGTIVVCFLVGYDGIPEYTSTAQSSGNRFLDSAALDSCIKWRFAPAKDTQGRLVRCLVYIPVTVKP